MHQHSPKPPPPSSPFLPHPAKGKWDWELWVTGDQQIDLLPRADGDVLFYPRTKTVHVTRTADCLPEIEPFTGRAGMVLEGKVTPPMGGVQIAVTVDKSEVATAVTDETGAYLVGKLYDDTDYKVSATKQGYHFEVRSRIF